MAPQAGPVQLVPDTLQVTAVFDVPTTDAVNCCVAPVVRETLVGVIVTTVAGTTVTSAVADLVGSTTLVTTTFTIAVDGATSGPV